MKTRDTFPGKTYSVHTTKGCTVSDDSGWSKTIAAPDGYFTAHGSTVYLSDDEATLREVFNVAPVVGGGGGSALSATGEKLVSLIYNVVDNGMTITTEGNFEVTHATWFGNNQKVSKVRVVPASWKKEVMTCYLKTTVPVELSGVTWIYGEPTMAAGYIYVIAMQQIDASTVLANLAYVLPQ